MSDEIDYFVNPGRELGCSAWEGRKEMITREWLDENIPIDELPVVVARVLGRFFNRPDPEIVINIGLLLQIIAEFVENDRFYGRTDPKPSWLEVGHPDYDPLGNTWAIHVSGLSYKASYNYLTAEGWPCGTKCWYMCVEWGWREYVAASSPWYAVLRTFVVLAAILVSRSHPPKKRGKLSEYVKQVMEGSYDAPGSV